MFWVERSKKQRLIQQKTEKKLDGIGGKGEVCPKISKYQKKSTENSLIYLIKGIGKDF